MPCMCYYHPSDEKLKQFKERCEAVVACVKEANLHSDAVGMTIQDAHQLIDHLYNPKLCTEKKTDAIPRQT